ncbi:MAG: aminoglycoside phosphotransferase family protein [Polyangiales bacterium]
MQHPSLTLPTLSSSEAEAIVREPVFSVTSLGQGARSRVYRVETEEGSVRVVRLTRAGSGRIERESFVASAIEKAEKKQVVPLVTALRVTHTPLSRECDVVTMREVKGSALGAVLRNALSADRERLFERMGEGLAAIHSIAVQGFGLLDSAGRGPFASWAQCFEATVRASLEELRVSPLSELHERAEHRLQQLVERARYDGPAILTHGDAQPMNVLVHNNAIVAWLDWEFAGGSDPRYELAYVETVFERAYAPWADEAERARWRAAFYRGYGSDPFATDPERRNAYALVHALRSTEFSSVMAPQLAPALRESTVRGMRSRVLDLLGDD